MTDENKESIYHKFDEQRIIRDFADNLCGDDDNRAGVFVASCAKFFEWSGGRLFFKKAGGEKIAATDPSVKEFFVENYKFLLPPPKVEEHEFNGGTVEIDPSIIESALGGSLTSKGKIARAFGADNTSSAASRAAAEKTELFLKAETKKRGGSDDGPKASNPWSAGGWNLTKQMQTHRADPALAERLAKAAHSRIGAAHPSKVVA